MTLDPAGWAVIGVIVGGAVTGLVTLGATWLQNKAASDLDAAKRLDDRRLARDAFQRDNLLETQVALNDWVRAVAVARMQDEKALRSGSASLPVQLPEAMAEAELSTGRRFMFLTERLLDDDLRKQLGGLRELWATHQVRLLQRDGSLTIEMLRAQEMDFGRAADAAQTALGAVLRTYLDAPRD